MQIDILWMRDNFLAFNARYFNDALPVPRFHAGHSRTRLGSLSFKRSMRWGQTHLYDFTITISNYYDQTEEQFLNVLLHEMIHYSIAHSGTRDSSQHGPTFRNMMEKLNKDGWNITVTTSTRDMKKAGEDIKNTVRKYLVLSIEAADGRLFLSSVNHKFAQSIDQRISQIPDIVHHAWYTTTDPWFETMPRVRTLRGRVVSREVYREKTEAMTPLHL